MSKHTKSLCDSGNQSNLRILVIEMFILAAASTHSTMYSFKASLKIHKNTANKNLFMREPFLKI